MEKRRKRALLPFFVSAMLTSLVMATKNNNNNNNRHAMGGEDMEQQFRRQEMAHVPKKTRARQQGQQQQHLVSMPRILNQKEESAQLEPKGFNFTDYRGHLQTIRRSTDACERVVKSMIPNANHRGQCTCTFHPVTQEIVSLECHYPDCQECVPVNNSPRDLSMHCTRLSTKAVVVDLEISHVAAAEKTPWTTECWTLANGQLRSDTVCYTQFLDRHGVRMNQCLFEVNGEYCNACRTDTCGHEENNHFVGPGHLDCSNLEDGAIWDVCNNVFDPRVQRESIFAPFSDVLGLSFGVCSGSSMLAADEASRSAEKGVIITRGSLHERGKEAEPKPARSSKRAASGRNVFQKAPKRNAFQRSKQKTSKNSNQTKAKQKIRAVRKRR